MNVFKFLAECRRDVSMLEELLPNSTFKMEDWKKDFPEVVVTLTTECHIELVKQYMAHIELVKQYMPDIDDSNVMIKTLAKANEYTGIEADIPVFYFSVN